LGPGRGVPLGGVRDGLLGGQVGAGQVHHLATEALHPAARFRLGVRKALPFPVRRHQHDREDHQYQQDHYDGLGHDALPLSPGGLTLQNGQRKMQSA
jgi:hypothetical protein